MPNVYAISPPFPVFTGLDGSPLEGGYIYIGVANQNPETSPITVYWDDALTIPAAQPIRTVGGYPARNGTPGRLFIASTFSLTVKTAKRELIYYAVDAAPIFNSSYVTFTPTGATSVPTSVSAKLQESKSVFDKMTTAQIADIQSGTASIDVSTFIQAAHDEALTLGGNRQGKLLFPLGRYRCDTGFTFNTTLLIEGYGAILDFSHAAANVVAIRWVGISTGDLFNSTAAPIKGLQLYGPGKTNVNSKGLVLGSGAAGSTCHERLTFDLTISEFGFGVQQDSNSYNVKMFGGYVYRNNVNFDFPAGLANNAEQIELHGVSAAESATANLRSYSNSLDIHVFGGSFDYDTIDCIDIAGNTIISFYGTHFEQNAGQYHIRNATYTGSPTANCYGCSFTTPNGSATVPIINADQMHFTVHGGWFRNSGATPQAEFVQSAGVYDLDVGHISILGALTTLAYITGGTGNKRIWHGGTAGYIDHTRPIRLTGGVALPEVVANYFGLVAPALGGANMGIFIRTAAGGPPGGEAGIEQGSLLLNQADKKLYINTGTNVAAIWTVVGTQT